jgi:hypothetical protein
MRGEYNHKFNPDLVEMNEKLRRDAMRTIENYGSRPYSDLPDMSDVERVKWFFWNMHENLDEFRKLEPTLIGQVMCTQTTISEGQSLEPQQALMQKHVTLHCKWHLRLVYSTYKNEEAYTVGDGAVDLLVSNTPPENPSLRNNQKGYLDTDSAWYPNQLFLYGWVTEAVWEEMKSHLYSSIPNCQTDILLRDNYIFPVKSGFDFVVGPPGSIGITNLEFQVSSYSGERRTSRRSQSLPR